MLYARRDFRPDHLPRLMSNMRWSWSLQEGKVSYTVSSRAASTHRQDYKAEHQGRQRTYDRKVVREAWADYLDFDPDE